MKQVLIAFVFIFYIAGCSRSIPTPKERLHVAQKLAIENALYVKTYKTKNFDIYSYSTKLSTCKDINIYIEGDGLAWITSSTISDNPTPINPLALKLMIKDNFICKLYLARPCQYIKNSTCKEKYWTSHRFSQEIVNSYNEVLNSFNGKTFKLFGYSGGGAIATLLARREDVTKLVSIAGNLDTEYWANKNYLTPLNGSLNPADFSSSLLHVKQFHLIGGKDNIIDKSICDSYMKNFDNRENITCRVYENFTHHQGWVENWTKILKYIGE